jgi:pimeloyl-ACP methyl ester carboxylesterase
MPGAELYYEEKGTGHLLILIAGSNGGGDIFSGLVTVLAEGFRMVIYDRRGFSRSKLVGPQDYAERLLTDVEDVWQLAAYLGDGRPVSVFGTDSGAIVVLALLARYPNGLHRVIAHEPPAVSLLPDAARWLTLFEEVQKTYKAEGVPKAMHLYASSIRSADHRLLMPYIREQTGERGWPMRLTGWNTNCSCTPAMCRT